MHERRVISYLKQLSLCSCNTLPSALDENLVLPEFAALPMIAIAREVDLDTVRVFHASNVFAAGSNQARVILTGNSQLLLGFVLLQ